MRVYRRLSGGRAVTIKSAHNCQDCQPRPLGQTPAHSLIRIREQICREILHWSCSCGEFKREKLFSILTLAGGRRGGGVTTMSQVDLIRSQNLAGGGAGTKHTAATTRATIVIIICEHWSIVPASDLQSYSCWLLLACGLGWGELC